MKIKLRKGVIYNQDGKRLEGCISSKMSHQGKIIVPKKVEILGEKALSGMGMSSVVLNDGLKEIEALTFYDCENLNWLNIPTSVESIGYRAFYRTPLSRVSEEPNVYYKAFKPDLTCRGFQYTEGEWIEFEGKVKLNEKGFHACKNAYDIFNFYWGTINKDFVVYEVEMSGVSKKQGDDDSRVVGKKIKLLRKIETFQDLLK